MLFEVRSQYIQFFDSPPPKKNNVEIWSQDCTDESQHYIRGGEGEGEVKTKTICQRKSELSALYWSENQNATYLCFICSIGGND